MSFGLKGQLISAQGTALGLKALISERSERAAYKRCCSNKKPIPCKLPFQGAKAGWGNFPGALPRAVVKKAFSLMYFED